MSAAFWQADDTSTDPVSYTTTSDEDVTISCDVTALLVGAGAPAVASTPAKLYRIVNNAADAEVTLADATTVNANILSQRIRGLVAGEVYRLRWRFVTSGNTRTCSTVIICTE